MDLYLLLEENVDNTLLTDIRNNALEPIADLIEKEGTIKLKHYEAIPLNEISALRYINLSSFDFDHLSFRP